MDLQRFLTGPTVELPEMLDAREHRAETQRCLRQSWPGHTLISFTMNIAGPVKVFPLSLRAYEEGVDLIRCQCKAFGIPLLHTEETLCNSGCEFFAIADADPLRVKQVLTELEENCSLGRLFDIDVLGSDGEKISRTQLNKPERGCLVCGKPGFDCSRGRVHTLDEILSRTCAILWDYFAERHAAKLASIAARALLYEVLATPKPGLVDKHNNGAHDDMDIVSFESSALSLLPYFKAFVSHGIQHSGDDPATLLEGLRPIGIQAEIAMLRVTGGVNTHKGILFSLGILDAALGVCYGRGETPHRSELQALCQAIAAPMAGDFARITADTAVSHGERLYAATGIRGARGEAIDGFPTLFETALPRMDGALGAGCSLNDAGVVTLLSIMAATQDTNLVTRSSYAEMETIRRELQEFLSATPDTAACLAKAETMDRDFIARHISPGGSADLLALTYFVKFLEQEGLTAP